jgi:dipeptidyl aminopeptidase/acylaminoacyl peptidase
VLDVGDLWEIRSAREAEIAPDGGRIAFCLTGLDRDRDRAWSELQLLETDADGAWLGPRALVRGRAPSWAPDGSALAFLVVAEAGEGTITELRLLSRDGDGERAVATLPGAAGAPRWSPDGERLALETTLGASGPSRIALFRLATGAVEFLAGAEGCDDTAPNWSPDGTRLAFARSRSRSAGGGPTSAIFVSPAGAGEPAPVATGLAFAGFPSWSPDGKTLACVGTKEERLGADDPCLQPWLVPASGGVARLAASGVNGVVVSPAPRGPTWSADGSTILFREARRGDINVAVAAVAQLAEVRTLTSGSQVFDFSVSADSHRLAFAAATSADPGGIYLLEDGQVRALLPSSAGWSNRRGVAVPVPARRKFRSPHGHSLDGWLQGLDPDRSPQPLLLALHGGPHAFFGTGFQLGHFYRGVLASRGWMVLTVNASGSGSYGEPFADGIRGRWGEYDLPEHLAALDELVAEGLADPARLVVAGYSYGGYLAAWAACMEDRFRAAIVGAPITNLESFERSSDIGAWYTPWEMGGGLPENRETYRRLSPINHISRLRTPLLLLHAEVDRRCPFEQSVEFLERARERSRAVVEIVPYAGADHLFYASGRPSQRLDFNHRVVEWAERMTEEDPQ